MGEKNQLEPFSAMAIFIGTKQKVKFLKYKGTINF